MTIRPGKKAVLLQHNRCARMPTLSSERQSVKSETFLVNERADDLPLIASSTTLKEITFANVNISTRIKVPESARWISTLPA